MPSSQHGVVIPFPSVRRQPEVRTPPESVSLLRVRFTLDDTEPLIWRRLELAGDLRLDVLHDVLQVAMGWDDSHLHQFLPGPGPLDRMVGPFVTAYAASEGDEGIAESDVRLDQVLAEVGDRLYYDYDFGDGWEHTLELEAVTEYAEGAPPARVLDGERACPPEDCGGIGGFEQVLMLAGHPERARFPERHPWLASGYDPDRFSAVDADELVRAITSARLLPAEDLTPSLADLVERSSRAPRPLSLLIARAELGDQTAPAPEEQQRMMRPLLHFLDVVGPDGLQLTPAGWLPPAVVIGLGTDLGLHEPWMGKGNREENMLPVRRLREAATALGLVRKLKGRLVLSPAGRGLVGDVDGMWRHVASTLPLGKKPWDRDAGTVMLLAVAAGELPYEGACTHGPTMLWHAGWSVDRRRPPSESEAIELARPTWYVLRVAGATKDWGHSTRLTDGGRQLARAALRR